MESRGERWLLTLEGSWGFRDYYQFNVVPSRDENIWRAATRLEYRWTEHWSLAGVFTYDRFDSENELFAASRYVTGLVTVFEY